MQNLNAEKTKQEQGKQILLFLEKRGVRVRSDEHVQPPRILQPHYHAEMLVECGHAERHRDATGVRGPHDFVIAENVQRVIVSGHHHVHLVRSEPIRSAGGDLALETFG
jgi:hypothetical protein